MWRPFRSVSVLRYYNDENAYYRSYKLCTATSGSNAKERERRYGIKRACEEGPTASNVRDGQIITARNPRGVRHPVENPFALRPLTELFFFAIISIEAYIDSYIEKIGGVWYNKHSTKVTKHNVIWWLYHILFIVFHFHFRQTNFSFQCRIVFLFFFFLNKIQIRTLHFVSLLGKRDFESTG